MIEKNVLSPHTTSIVMYAYVNIVYFMWLNLDKKCVPTINSFVIVENK